jgi:predicted nucleic acid-binding protein
LTLVIDASVALKWFIDEDGSDRAAALLDGKELLIAPDLIVAEVCNAGWKAVRAGTALPQQLEVMAARLPVVLDELVPLANLAPDAVAAALALDHPVYDCCYLVLASQRQAHLVTAHRRLLARVAGTRWDAGVVALSNSV